jgi:hypothetical protein
MPRRTERPASGHHIVIDDEDWEYLESRYGARGIKPVGVSFVLRAMIRRGVMEMRQAEEQRRPLPAAE